MIISFLMRHAVVRRMCSVTFLMLLCAVSIFLVPVAVLLGGRTRTARFARFAGAYLAAEVSGLCGAASLRTSDQDAHYALLTRLLSLLFRTARRAFRFHVLPPEQGLELPDGPLLVFSRHAGPGDSFLLVYALLAVGGRRPRVVLKQSLVLDPVIDVLLSRMPNCFVGSGEAARAEATRCIGELSAGLGPRDALLLFPEGGNFTSARRGRLISRLRRQREWRDLPTAVALDHLLPAQPAGVFAAIDAAPRSSTVVFVAHTGLDRLQTFADTWHAVPLDRPVQLAWWAVPVVEVPTDERARQAWLEDRWARIDAWIDHRTTGVDGPDECVPSSDAAR